MNTDEPQENRHQPATGPKLASQLLSSTGLGSVVAKLNNPELADESIIDRFVRQPTPRQLPLELRKIFRIDPLVKFVSSLFTVGGILLAILLSTGGEVEGESTLAGSLLGVGISALGIGVLSLVNWFSYRQRKLLCQGRVIFGVIESVEESIFVSGNQRVYRIKFRQESDSAIIESKLKGTNAEQARQFLESAQVIRALQHPEDARKIILIDCYSIV